VAHAGSPQIGDRVAHEQAVDDQHVDRGRAALETSTGGDD
jgi:hypothetical protein